MVVIENEIDMKRTTKSISVSSQHSPPAVLLLPQLLLPAALLVHRGTNLSIVGMSYQDMYSMVST